jgi:hypothetical protein
MLLLGCILLLLADLVHSWWGAQAKADLDQKAVGFILWGLKPIYVTILLLAVGEGLIWYGGSLGWALAAVPIYFFVLPVVTWPILRLTRLIPALPETDYEKIRTQREYERMIAETPEEKLMRMETVRDIQKCFFVSKRALPGEDESFHLFSALRTHCKGYPDEAVRELATKCATLDDAMVEAVRVESGDQLARMVSTVLGDQPLCARCRDYRAMLGPVCYGCLTSRTPHDRE